MNEPELLQRLHKIERLFAGAASQGEREAAAGARDRIRERLAELVGQEKAVEYKFTLPDRWSRRLLVAMLRRYELTPYRYKGQKRTTVMTRVQPSFVKETLWPEFRELNEVLTGFVSDLTDQIIQENVWSDASEVTEREPRQLKGDPG